MSLVKHGYKDAYTSSGCLLPLDLHPCFLCCLSVVLLFRSSIYSFPLQMLLFTPSASNFNFFLAYTSSLKASCSLSLPLSSAFTVFQTLSLSELPGSSWLFLFWSYISVSLALWRTRALSVFPWIREGWGPSVQGTKYLTTRRVSVCELILVLLTCHSAASAERLSTH